MQIINFPPFADFTTRCHQSGSNQNIAEPYNPFLIRLFERTLFGKMLKVYSWLVAQKSVKGAVQEFGLFCNDVKAIFHRPHPRKEAKKGAVVSMRRFLTEAGVTPDDGI